MRNGDSLCGDATRSGSAGNVEVRPEAFPFGNALDGEPLGGSGGSSVAGEGPLWYSGLAMHPADEDLRWTERARKPLASCAFFQFYSSERLSRSGKSATVCLLSSPDWVNVVPVVKDPRGEECFLMVRQYRHGADLITTEFPAGLVEPGEDPLSAAHRELTEETGYRAGRMTLLGRVAPNPAFMDNWCSTFLAEDLALEVAPSPDETEELATVVLPAREVYQGAGRGELVNSLVLVGLLWYRLAGQS